MLDIPTPAGACCSPPHPARALINAVLIAGLAGAQWHCTGIGRITLQSWPKACALLAQRRAQGGYGEER